MWHTLYPELAGAAQEKRGTKRTVKALKFLASILTFDEWWKDYGFASEDERYRLCGLDCCITYDIAEQLLAELAIERLSDVYRRSMRRIPPVVMAQARGIKVDEERRLTSIAGLDALLAPLEATMAEIAAPFIAEWTGNKSLFEEIWTCPCCRNGKGKRSACWSCAGFPKLPGKRAQAALEIPLGLCTVCGGEGQRTTLVFNPNSSQQKAILLYDILRLPRHYNEGKPTTDEGALKSILAQLGGVT